jgi:hypothetical protein
LPELGYIGRVFSSSPTGSAPTAKPSGLSRWALAALYAACATVLVADAGHFLPPAGERFVDYLRPGAADLIPTVNAANALLHGENPYHARKLLVADPYETSRGSAAGFTYLYPPSHALLYVPLTWLAHGDYQLAMRLQFGVEILCIALLGLFIVRLLGSTVSLPVAVQYALLPGLCFALGLNPGNQLGLERGQSDLITAAFGWGAVLAFSRERWLAAAFLCVASTLLKGYGILFASGLLVLGSLQDFRRTALGAVAALALLFAPVARYLPDALAAYKIRSAMFWTSWTNQSFANLARALELPRNELRVGLTLAAVSCCALAFWQLSQTLRSNDDPARRSLWLSAYATAAFTSVIGYSLNSIAYDAVLVMPGALVLALSQERLLAPSAALARAALGVSVCACMVALFVFDLGQALGFTDRWHLPASALGQLGMVALIGLSAARALGRSSARQRWLVRAGGAAFALAIALYLSWDRLDAWAAGPDLAAGKPWTTSSTAFVCNPALHNCGGKDSGVFFHTQLENGPWLRIDLGAEHALTRVELQNRQDCCQDRAVPLVIELSRDGSHFHTVSVQREVFDELRVKFPRERARYVRLRVLRQSALHLERVWVR